MERKGVKYDEMQRMVFENRSGLKERSLMKTLVLRAQDSLKKGSVKYVRLIGPSEEEEVSSMNERMT